MAAGDSYNYYASASPRLSAGSIRSKGSTQGNINPGTDSGRLQRRVKVEIRASHFRGVGRNCVMPHFSGLLQKPQINRLTRKARRGLMGPLCLSPQLSVGLFWQRHVEILHVSSLITVWHRAMPRFNAR
jgi:hypothetical protein